MRDEYHESGCWESISDFYVELFSPEWKKFFLSILMVLLLSVSAFSTLSLKQSPELDRRMEISVETPEKEDASDEKNINNPDENKEEPEEEAWHSSILHVKGHIPRKPGYVWRESG